MCKRYGYESWKDKEGTIEVNISMVSFSSSQLLSEHGSGIHVGLGPWWTYVVIDPSL